MIDFFSTKPLSDPRLSASAAALAQTQSPDDPSFASLLEQAQLRSQLGSFSNLSSLNSTFSPDNLSGLGLQNGSSFDNDPFGLNRLQTDETDYLAETSQNNTLLREAFGGPMTEIAQATAKLNTGNAASSLLSPTAVTQAANLNGKGVVADIQTADEGVLEEQSIGLLANAEKSLSVYAQLAPQLSDPQLNVTLKSAYQSTLALAQETIQFAAEWMGQAVVQRGHEGVLDRLLDLYNKVPVEMAGLKADLKQALSDLSQSEESALSLESKAKITEAIA